MTEFSGAEVQIQEDGGVEEDPEEHLLLSVIQILICKIIQRSCVYIYMTWEERGGFMSGGTYISEIRRFLILYTVSLGKTNHLFDNALNQLILPGLTLSQINMLFITVSKTSAIHLHQQNESRMEMLEFLWVCDTVGSLIPLNPIQYKCTV